MAEHIQTIQPTFGLVDEWEEHALNAFWSNVAADPSVVVIVQPISGGEDMSAELCDVAIFSSYSLALEHARSLPCHGALVIPKRLDEPGWGNGSVN